MKKAELHGSFLCQTNCCHQFGLSMAEKKCDKSWRQPELHTFQQSAQLSSKKATSSIWLFEERLKQVLKRFPTPALLYFKPHTNTSSPKATYSSEVKVFLLTADRCYRLVSSTYISWSILTRRGALLLGALSRLKKSG